MPQIVTSFTRLLEQTTTANATATMPEIASGENRRAVILLVATSGSGAVQAPVTITVNGITRYADVVPDGGTLGVSIGLYTFTETEIETISGETIESTITGSGTLYKAIWYMLIEDCDQGPPNDVGFDYNNDGNTSSGNLNIPLSRAAESLTIAVSRSETGQLLNLANPANTGVLYSTGSSGISNYAINENETGGTVSFSSTRHYRTAAIAVNFAKYTDPEPEGPAINPTGTTTSAAPGGAFTVNLSNMDGRTVASLELYDPASGVSTAQSYTGTTSLTGTVTLGNLPYRSGMEWVVTLDNAAELTAEFEMVPAAGRSLTEIEADFDETDQSIGYGFDPALEVGSQLEYATDTLTVYPDALFYTDYEGSQVVNHWLPSTKQWYQETIITGDLPSEVNDMFKLPTMAIPAMKIPTMRIP